MRVHEVTNVFWASLPPFCLSNSAETLPKGAAELCSALRKGFSRIRKAKWRRWSTKNVHIFSHTSLLEIIYICAALTSQVLSTDTKFSSSQSRETLPLIYQCTALPGVRSRSIACILVPLALTKIKHQSWNWFKIFTWLSCVQDTTKPYTYCTQLWCTLDQGFGSRSGFISGSWFHWPQGSRSIMNPDPDPGAKKWSKWKNKKSLAVSWTLLSLQN